MQQDSCNKPSTGCLKDCESRHSFHKEARELNAAPLPRAPFPGFSLGLLNCFPKPSERSPIAFLPFLFLQAHSWIGKHYASPRLVGRSNTAAVTNNPHDISGKRSLAALGIPPGGSRSAHAPQTAQLKS